MGLLGVLGCCALILGSCALMKRVNFFKEKTLLESSVKALKTIQKRHFASGFFLLLLASLFALAQFSVISAFVPLLGDTAAFKVGNISFRILSILNCYIDLHVDCSLRTILGNHHSIILHII